MYISICVYEYVSINDEYLRYYICIHTALYVHMYMCVSMYVFSYWYSPLCKYSCSSENMHVSSDLYFSFSHMEVAVRFLIVYIILSIFIYRCIIVVTLVLAFICNFCAFKMS